MSSIRPLATITVLTFAGVFLWLKINEKEPELPSEIADWSAPAGLEIGSPTGMPGAPMIESAMPATTAQSFQSAPTFGDAPPAFRAAPVAETAAPPVTTAAPAFAPSAPAVEEPQAAAPPADDLQVPDLPPLPEFPEFTSSNLAAPAIEAPTAAPPAVEEAPPVFSEPAETTPPPPVAQQSTAPSTNGSQPSPFASTRLTVQSALDRGELSQALLMLSDWYGDPSLSPQETQEVNTLLSQLAGSVIYSREHRLEPPYRVQPGENLRGIAQKYEVPWQLLAKINGITDPDALQPGQELKVVRGPFSAKLDLGQRRMTLMLDRRYAGEFPIEVEPSTTVEQGHWTVNQKMLTPGNSGFDGAAGASEQRSIMLNSATAGASQIVIIRGSKPTGPTPTDPTGRVIRMKDSDVDDVFDILRLGSQVTIRR